MLWEKEKMLVNNTCPFLTMLSWANHLRIVKVKNLHIRASLLFWLHALGFLIELFLS